MTLYKRYLKEISRLLKELNNRPRKRKVNKTSSILVCPSTRQELTDLNVYASGGVCIHCLHDNRDCVTHYDTQMGIWVKPNPLQYLLGFRKQFIYIHKTLIED